jgi:exopolyphosphatase / guanosine-5'-triphosphate,3'-diphosphate pyrophosphatase
MTGPIIPRWEWRTFGDRFGAADERLGALPVERAEESSEVYLLSLRSDASVKIRGGLMDVKQLETVGDDGLEQWRPIMKASFPLPREEAGAVLAALGVATSPPAGNAYSFDEFVDQLIRPDPELLAVHVQKRREHYTVGGCMAERTEIGTEHGAIRTIAVESEDPARVIEAVRELGFASQPNVSVPKGLKALVGFGARRYAVIDIGANSVKFVVADLRADGSWQSVVDRAEVTRVSEGVAETGRLDPEASERTLDAIAGMADEARRDGATEIAAVATAGLRLAADRSEFVAAVRERCDLDVEILSGDDEARLGYLAATSGLATGRGSLLVFDSGGGSTEFTFGTDEHVDERFSLDVGAVGVTERFDLSGIVADDALAAALDGVAAELAKLRDRPTPDAVIAMGGTATNLAAVKHGLAEYDPDVVQGTELDAGEVDRQIELYRTRAAETRRQIAGLQPGRADVILGGACIVRTVMTTLGRQSVTVSDRGLRHGLLVERFGTVGSG